jgi:hypothetical protein
LEDGTRTWAPAPQDTDFLDRAPDECPREPMLRARNIFLRLSAADRAQRMGDTYKFVRDYTGIGEQDIAPHVVVCIAVAQEDKEAEDWSAKNVLGPAEMTIGFPQLRARVYIAQPMKEGEREEYAPDISDEAAKGGGTGFHAGALGFTQEDVDAMAAADLELRRIHGAEVRLGGLRLREAQALPRRP